jgi:YebC/PmpR family DNA-binding regulatory protein
MSGHSKWSTIKRKKGAADAKRGAVFTKIIREITVATRTGGSDREGNASLKAAISKAKAANMPNDNVDRAIKKATGDLDGVIYSEVRYEAYGPGGIAIMVDCLTDNKNRTTPEIKTIFGKNGGNLGETGSVNYMFDRKGQIIVEAGQTNEDDLMELLMEYDLEDIQTEEKNLIVTTTPEGFAEISSILESKDYTLLMNEISYLAQVTVELNEKKAGQTLRLIEFLEEHDDVQNVYSNFDISDEIMEALAAADK